MNNIMKDIPGYEGAYAITKDGKVWSHPKGKRREKHMGMWLNPFKNYDGRLMVNLSKIKHKKSYSIAKLLVLTYLKYPPQVINKKNKFNIVIFKDGNKSNIKLDNLAWSNYFRSEIYNELA